jgi:hypothetical protein
MCGNTTHKFLFFILIFCYMYQIEAKSAITYTFSGGRLGDNLLSYAHAKWLSYKYDIPLLYVPFPYSQCLVMHNVEIHLTDELMKQYKAVLSYKDVNGFIDPESDFIYVVPFFCESIIERNDPKFPYLYDVDWHDKGFKAELKKMIKPLAFMPIIELPPECITIAVHVRRGTGFDILPGQNFADMTRGHALKWPPDSYYIENIERIVNHFPDKKIYIYIFTDHDNPIEIVHYYKETLANPRIIFGYRVQENKHYLNVLEDFFALTQFDCLIRPDSNFSVVASKIGDYKILISPWHTTQKDEEIIIDEIIIEQN